MSVNDEHYCMCLTGEDLPDEDVEVLDGMRAAGLKAAQWKPNTAITVRFLEGDSGLRQRVQKVAMEWAKARGGPANLRLDFVTSGSSNIRIAFQPGKGSWSQLGTFCLSVPEPQATMNFGWLTPASSEDEVRRVVLHEFGHALGLIHEHQNPQGGIKWNRPAVIQELSHGSNKWTEAQIELNMFKKYTPQQINATNMDPLSIMMYPIPKAWTLDGFSAGLNKDLSAMDRELVRRLYP